MYAHTHTPVSIQDGNEAKSFLLHGVDGLGAGGLGGDGDGLALGQAGEREVPPRRQGALRFLQTILIQPLVVSKLSAAKNFGKTYNRETCTDNHIMDNSFHCGHL